MDQYLGTLRDKMIRETEQFLEGELNEDLRRLTAETLSPRRTPFDLRVRRTLSDNAASGRAFSARVATDWARAQAS